MTARTWSLLLVLLVCASDIVDAGAPETFGDSPCLRSSPEDAASQCEQLARDVSHDIRMTRELGYALEHAGRYRDAETVYRVALTVHPQHRDLLQGLIRARGLIRSAQLLARPTPNDAAPPTPPPTPRPESRPSATAAPTLAANPPAT